MLPGNHRVSTNVKRREGKLLHRRRIDAFPRGHSFTCGEFEQQLRAWSDAIGDALGMQPRIRASKRASVHFVTHSCIFRCEQFATRARLCLSLDEPVRAFSPIRTIQRGQRQAENFELDSLSPAGYVKRAQRPAARANLRFSNLIHFPNSVRAHRRHDAVPFKV